MRTSLPADGVLLVDKPAGPTSHDAVARARRVLRERRIGHLGTLDPFATGLLVLLVGRATRLACYMDGEPKVYDAVIRFGSETATDDLTGELVRTAGLPDPDAVRAAIAQLTGELEQQPPAFSAKQVGGERAHAAARAGQPLELRAVRVLVHEWSVHTLSAERAAVTIRCGGGTYIRALARDLGRLAGSAAHLETLRRTASGPFKVADAAPLDALDGALPPPLRSPLDGLTSLAHVRLDAEQRRQIVRGIAVPARTAGSHAALLDDEGAIVAIADRVRDAWQPRVVLQDA